MSTFGFEVSLVAARHRVKDRRLHQRGHQRVAHSAQQRVIRPDREHIFPGGFQFFVYSRHSSGWAIGDQRPLVMSSEVITESGAGCRPDGSTHHAGWKIWNTRWVSMEKWSPLI